jgi:predicted DNA-binding protein (UPF0251 family)
MPRPRGSRHISETPKVTFYKPQGIPLHSLENIEITHEEWEVLRLKHVEMLDQIESAKKMKTSQSTLQRILSVAQQKIGQAIVEGKAIKIIKE